MNPPRHRRLALVIAAAALGVGVAGAPAAQARPQPLPTDVTLTGGGKVLGSAGDRAVVYAELVCPRGETWSLDAGGAFGSFAFAFVGRDDTYASVDAGQSGKCSGKTQKVKIAITAFYNPPIPRNCSAEYAVRFTLSDGTQIERERGGAGPATGPSICLS